MSCASCSEPVKRSAKRKTAWSYWRTKASKADREPFCASRISSVSVARPHASLAMPDDDCTVRLEPQAVPPALTSFCDAKGSASADMVTPTLNRLLHRRISKLLVSNFDRLGLCFLYPWTRARLSPIAMAGLAATPARPALAYIFRTRLVAF